MSAEFSPYRAEWNFGPIPEVESVPPDAVLIVWGEPYVGRMYTWGDRSNPTRWVGYDRPHVNCIDGKWSVYDAKKTEYGWVEMNVWWTWDSEGTAGMIHDYPTWRQVNGRL